MLYNILFEGLSSNKNASILGRILASINTLEGIHDYCKKNFTFIGHGNSRAVYNTGFGFVVKVSRRHGVINQNKIELERKRDCLDDRFFAKIYSYDKVNFWWLISEYAEAFTDERAFIGVLVKKLQGTDEEIVRAISDNLNGSQTFSNILSDAIYTILYGGTPEFEVNQWLKDFMKSLTDCKVDPHDFHEENWGVRQNGDLILIDYGF